MVGLLKARQKLRVAGIAVIPSYTMYTRIYKRATIVVKRIFVVSDVRLNDVMRIPRGQPHAALFTRPFLDFFVGGPGLRDYYTRGMDLKAAMLVLSNLMMTVVTNSGITLL